MTAVAAAAGVSVSVRGTVVEAAERVHARLARDGVPAALMARNPNLWGPAAAARAARRLGWLGLPHGSRSLQPELRRLAAAHRDLDRVVVVGMGGSALAARAIVDESARAAGACAARGSPAPCVRRVDRAMALLDTTDPQRVATLLGDGLRRTVVVVIDPAGATPEVDALYRIFAAAFRARGLDESEVRRRFVVVTSPESPRERAARAAGHQVLLIDSEVDERFDALGPAGLVPSALAGADPADPLDSATALWPALHRPFGNPGLMLGAALGASALAGRDKLVIAPYGAGSPVLARWVAELIAETTGKHGRGIPPCVVEAPGAAGFEPAPDTRRVILGGPGDGPALSEVGARHDVGLLVSGPLGAQFLLWEYAAAVAARVVGVSPFDRPDIAAPRCDDAAPPREADEVGAPAATPGERPVLVDGPVEVHAPAAAGRAVADVRGLFDRLIDMVPDRGHLAITAFLDPVDDAAVAGLRPAMAARVGAVAKAPFPVTFAWGPRALHSTRQAETGGPPGGVFVHITGATEVEVPVPGRPSSLAALQLAQACGDLRALRDRGRPAVRLHLRDRSAGVDRLLSALS